MDDSTTGKWLKLKQGNDWGKIYYARNPHTEYGSANSALGIKFVEGMRVGVRWPDGTTSLESISLLEIWDTVSDHGHETTVKNLVPIFNTKVRGIPMVVHLRDVEVWDQDIPADGKL